MFTMGCWDFFYCIFVSIWQYIHFYCLICFIVLFTCVIVYSSTGCSVYMFDCLLLNRLFCCLHISLFTTEHVSCLHLSSITVQHVVLFTCIIVTFQRVIDLFTYIIVYY